MTLERHLTTHLLEATTAEAELSPTVHRTKRSDPETTLLPWDLTSERVCTAGREEGEQPPLLLSVTARTDVCWEGKARAEPALGRGDGLDDLSCQCGLDPLTHSWTVFCWVKCDITAHLLQKGSSSLSHVPALLLPPSAQHDGHRQLLFPQRSGTHVAGPAFCWIRGLNRLPSSKAVSRGSGQDGQEQAPGRERYQQ